VPLTPAVPADLKNPLSIADQLRIFREDAMTRGFAFIWKSPSVSTKHGESSLNQMGAMTLVQNATKGYGTHFPKDQQLEQVIILDRDDDAASVKIDAATWIDYL
jgi:hypothetical protein